MDFTEKTISSEYVFRGKVIDVKKDNIFISNGHRSIREVVEHTGGVVILAHSFGNILLTKQFRYPISRVSLELPAGKLEKDEAPDSAAKRELEEETGYIAKKWVSLGYIYTSPGFCNEKLHLFLAEDLVYEMQKPDEDEIIECQEYPITEIRQMIDDGRINDAKTICTILRAEKYLL